MPLSNNKLLTTRTQAYILCVLYQKIEHGIKYECWSWCIDISTQRYIRVFVISLIFVVVVLFSSCCCCFDVMVFFALKFSFFSFIYLRNLFEYSIEFVWYEKKKQILYQRFICSYTWKHISLIPAIERAHYFIRETNRKMYYKMENCNCNWEKFWIWKHFEYVSIV